MAGTADALKIGLAQMGHHNASEEDDMERTVNLSRLTPVDPGMAEGKARALLDQVRRKLGRTPNMMRTMASSPAVLDKVARTEVDLPRVAPGVEAGR